VLVAASALIDWVRRMDRKGIHGNSARIGWSELMRFKQTFTDPVPEETETSFAKAGIDSFHGVAHFTDPTQLQVGEDVPEGRRILIAAGAKPQKLNIPGEQYLTTSEQFLELAKPVFISYKRKRTMSLIDEFNAATQSLDRILEKMEEADPADKERLEAYVKSMQVKVQRILKAILRVH
jgi:hypothetical protein